jgi:hypothetical protein
MAILAARKRIVTFRLTETEFAALRRVCEVAGSRSMSDFARDAVMQKVQSHTVAKPGGHEDLRALNHRLEDLADGVRDLRNRIARVLSPGASEV